MSVREAIDSALWDGVNCWSDGERENDPDAFERELEARGYVIVPKNEIERLRKQVALLEERGAKGRYGD